MVIRHITHHGYSLAWNGRSAVVIRFLYLKKILCQFFSSVSLGSFLKDLPVDFAAESIFKVDNTVYCLSAKKVKSISHEYLSPGVNELNFYYGNYKLLTLVVI